MTKKEFEERTRRLITAEDYRLVENLYMAAGDMAEDEFCREMRAMCAYDYADDHIELRRCLKEIGRRVGSAEARIGVLKKTADKRDRDLAEFLIGKACAYGDADFHREAVRLVGQREVTLMKLRMGLPLRDEDKACIARALEGTE